MGTDENKVKRTYEWRMRTCQWHAYKSIQNVNNKDWQQMGMRVHKIAISEGERYFSQNNKILNL